MSVHVVSGVVGFASVPVASTYVWPPSAERQKPSVFEPLTLPTNAYTRVCAGSSVAPTASVARPVPSVAGVAVTRVQVTPTSDRHSARLLPAAHAAPGSAP